MVLVLAMPPTGTLTVDTMATMVEEGPEPFLDVPSLRSKGSHVQREIDLIVPGWLSSDDDK